MYQLLHALFIVLCCVPTLRSAGQQPPARVTRLRVTESALLSHREYVVTTDQLRIEVLAGSTDTVFVRALTPRERDQLLSGFDHLYLSQLQEEYARPQSLAKKEGAMSSQSCPTSYLLVVLKGEYANAVSVTSDYKLMALYTFSQQLNTLLPKVYQIGYSPKVERK